MGQAEILWLKGNYIILTEIENSIHLHMDMSLKLFSPVTFKLLYIDKLCRFRIKFLPPPSWIRTVIPNLVYILGFYIRLILKEKQKILELKILKPPSFFHLHLLEIRKLGAYKEIVTWKSENYMGQELELDLCSFSS